MLKRLVLAFFLTVCVSVPPALAAEMPAPGSEKRIPFKTASENEGGASVLRVVFGLGSVLAVGAVAIYALRRYLPGSYGSSTVGSVRRQMEVVEVRRLTPKLTLFLIEVGGERILLAQSGDGVSRVHQYRARSTGSSDVTSAGA